MSTHATHGKAVRSDDDWLIGHGANERSKMLAGMYMELVGSAVCSCGTAEHSPDEPTCPMAIWEQAARMAILTVED